MAGTMGLAINNTRAVFEGLMSRKSEFVRTPKFKVVNKNDDTTKNIYIKRTKVQVSTYIEILMALYCLIGVAASIYFLELASLPFQLMFFFGFASVSILSLRQTFLKNQTS
jgi:hypothetical protein